MAGGRREFFTERRVSLAGWTSRSSESSSKEPEMRRNVWFPRRIRSDCSYRAAFGNSTVPQGCEPGRRADVERSKTRLYDDKALCPRIAGRVISILRLPGRQSLPQRIRSVRQRCRNRLGGIKQIDATLTAPQVEKFNARLVRRVRGRTDRNSVVCSHYC